MKLKASTYNQLQTLCWTEDNRLQAVKDDKMGVYYNYDATGERNLKLTGTTIDLTQNGTTINIPILDQQTLYASALVTVNDKGYTKHYFEEGKRICSKIGSGELQDIWTLSTPIEGDYQNIHDHRSIGGVIKIFDICMKLPVEIKNKDLFKEIILPYESQVNSSEPVFYYHSDHLGSASYITDDSGIETQHLVYLPFGEDWVDMKYNTGQYETPYKFNGKEKDQETGYNYFGARYYYDWASIWLSVDPMSDERPNLTSYNYCQNNPIMLIDPDGNLDDNYIITYQGDISKETTNDKTNTYTYLNESGDFIDLGTYDVTSNSKGEDMVQAGKGATGVNAMYKWAGISSGNLSFEEDAFAGFLGAVQNFYDKEPSASKVQVNQFMSEEKIHSNKGNRKSTMDIAYYFNNGRTGARTTDNNISKGLNQSLLNSFKRFGLAAKGSSFTSTQANNKVNFLEGTTGAKNHHHHIHIGGFSKNISRLLSPVEIIDKK